MIVRAECEKCSHKWDLEMKPMETITCPNCKTVYDALIVVNDPENEKTMRIVRKNRSRKINKVTHNCDNINCNHNDTKGLCCLFNPENCKYRQLQKENAELKEKNNNLVASSKTIISLSDKIENRTMEQLTKAKEIIKSLLSFVDSLGNYSGGIFTKAEQFLKDSEVVK